MNSELAQAIALVAHGNEALKSGKAANLEDSNTTFHYVGEVHFTYAGDDEAVEVASRTQDWFAWLGSKHVRRLHLGPSGSRGPLPAHIASSFAGGGEWQIVAAADSATQYWDAGWAFGGRGLPRPWRVDYLGRLSATPWPNEPRNLSDARRTLENALVDAAETARAMNEPGWEDWFRHGLAELSNPSPFARFHDDALSGGYTLEARQLYCAAVGSWVFGGMGSWNDVPPHDPDLNRRYERVSADLYTAILQAFEAVLDSKRLA